MSTEPSVRRDPWRKNWDALLVVAPEEREDFSSMGGSTCVARTPFTHEARRHCVDAIFTRLKFGNGRKQTLRQHRCLFRVHVVFHGEGRLPRPW